MNFNENDIEWNNDLLGDICTIKGGKRLPKGKQLSSNKTRHPYIKVKDIGENKYISLNSGFEYLDDETFEGISRYIVNENDLIISIVGTIGLIGLIDKSLESANLTENCVKLIDIKNVTNDFLYYYLKSPVGGYEIKKGVVGSTQPKLPIYNIQKIAISYPSISEQKAIAKILSDLDEKIETNNKINKKLEEMAQAIFKQWFVDFEFPNEEGKPYKSSGGEMVESELGMVPKGWDVIKLEEICSISTKSEKPFNNSDTIYEHFSLPACDEGKLPIVEAGKNISSNKYKIDNECILISKLNPSTKRIWNPFCKTYNAICSTEFIVYKPKERDIKSFCYEVINSNRFTEFLLANVTGSTGSRQRVRPQNTLTYKVPFADTYIIKKSCELIEPIHKKIQLNIEENLQLKNIRDALLPKLMSGEIRVPLGHE